MSTKKKQVNFSFRAEAGAWEDFIAAANLNTLGSMRAAFTDIQNIDGAKAQMIRQAIEVRHDTLANQLVDNLRAENITVNEATMILDIARIKVMNTMLSV